MYNNDSMENHLLITPNSEMIKFARKIKCKRIILIVLCAVSSIIGLMVLFTTWKSNMTDNDIKTDVLVAIIIGTIALHLGLPLASFKFLLILQQVRGYRLFDTSSELRTGSVLKAIPNTNSRNQSNNPVRNVKHNGFEFNFKRRAISILIGFALLGLLLPILGDIYKAHYDLRNKTSISNSSWYKIRIGFRLTAYCINLIPIGMTLYCISNIYMNIIRKSDQIRYMCLENQEQFNNGIQELEDWSYNICRLNKSSKVRNELYYANQFFAVSLVCYLIWLGAYIFYVLTVKEYDRFDLYIKAFGYVFTYTILIIFMWITNNIVDDMKETINIVQNKYELSADYRLTLTSTIQGCNPYALLFTKKPSIPMIMVEILSGIIPIVLTYLRRYWNI